MSMLTALHDALTADATVSGIVGAKVASIMAAQPSALPFITYQVLDSRTVNHLTGVTTTWNAHVQVNCNHSTIAGAKTLATAVSDVLNGWSSSGDGVSMCQLENQVEDMEGPDDASAIGVTRIIQTYTIWYSTA